MIHQPDRRFCAHSEDDLAGVSSDCKWPMPSIAIFQELQILDPVTCNRVLQRICTAWNSTANLQLHVTQTADHANVHTTSGPIDGPMGVLGQSYLPCGNVGPTTQLAQLLDNGENWDEDMLFRVWLHEVGHALGLEHAPQGSGAIMEPYLTTLEAPQAEDIQQMQERYGPPVTVPVPAPDPTPTPSGQQMLSFDAAGFYLVQVSCGGAKGGAVLKIPAAGSYPVDLTISRR